MERPKFRPRYGGIGKMLRSKEMKAAMVVRAERIQQRAEGFAPRRTGDYARSFRVKSGQSRGPGDGRRAWAKVINTSDHSTAVEWGASRTPRYRPLGRAAAAERGR
ncbi:HK97 gp10 family phage protein [Actinomadura decatromicini]|uniref:HK97 gp10 family phage protein n=1 Tax=Actinomadura decatromicini TaxID=2604572 RepID=A0A5D3F817_9ACTN|nr:HK97 gp10 family phage protein [Actinomadura decatromicini]TYK45157.1 HK97 gp10 family phage protein [Actinomadura decatromicini]